jgi:hypothetical protein
MDKGCASLVTTWVKETASKSKEINLTAANIGFSNRALEKVFISFL